MTDIDDWGDPLTPVEEEPDEPPPLDLDQVGVAYHAALAEDWSGIPEHSTECLAAVPELLARLRAAEAQIEEWSGYAVAVEYQATTNGWRPSSTTSGVPITRAVADQITEEPHLTTAAWSRSIHTSGWVPHSIPPF